MDISSIIILAYKLTFLTFNLGVLIYALPIPWSSVKAWGPRLIGDSIAAFTLLTLYYVLLEISNQIPLYLGGSWDYFGVWINNIVLFAASLKELVIVAYTAAKAAGISRAVSTILWPIDRLANVLWLFIISVYGFALLVKNYYYALVGLGMALYSLPFRVGRSAGAWLTAFGIVFNAGLPVLPVFVSWLYQADGVQGSPITEYGLVYVSATIADSQGNVLDHGILKVRILTGEGFTLVGSYPVVGGKAYTVNDLDYIPIPSRIDSYMYLELAGVVFALTPYPLKPSQIEASTGGYNVDLRAKHIIWHRADLIVFTNTLNYRILEEGASSVLVEVNLTREGYVEVRAPKGCEYRIEAPGEGAVYYRGSWTWLGVTGSYSRVYLGKGSHTVKVSITSSISSCRMNPQYPEPIDYFLDYMGGGILFDVNIVKLIVIVYLTMPIMYLLILSSIAYGVARLIGGRERIMPRIV